MKFKTLDQLIDFEKNIQWVNSAEVKLENYKISSDIQGRFDRLKNQKFLGVYGNEVVAAVSDQFSIINVEQIAEACDKAFGSEYTEKSFKEGIIRIYNNGEEDLKGKVAPMVIYPANLGNMAVRLGLYHVAYVCTNGMIIADSKISQKIIHRSTDADLTVKTKLISENLGEILSRVDLAETTVLNPGIQLAMIVEGLDKKDALVKKAIGKYSPEKNTLWDTVQTITYVATHETKEGFGYSKNAGELLLNPALAAPDIVDAACYVFSKENKGAMNFPNSKSLYALASLMLCPNGQQQARDALV